MTIRTAYEPASPSGDESALVILKGTGEGAIFLGRLTGEAADHIQQCFDAHDQALTSAAITLEAIEANSSEPSVKKYACLSAGLIRNEIKGGYPFEVLDAVDAKYPDTDSFTSAAHGEKVAQIIFNAMRWAAQLPRPDDKPVSEIPQWQAGGNSFAQHRAREAAKEIFPNLKG